MTHAKWDGVTFADLVFPSFVFILGAAIPFAFARRLESGGSHRALYVRIWRRAAWLMALGLRLNLVAAFPDLAAIRIPGVLQRIAFAYLIAAPLVIDLRPSRRASVAAAFLLVHWALLSMPIGASVHGLSEADNLAGLIDRALLGRHTLTPTGDPEGISARCRRYRPRCWIAGGRLASAVTARLGSARVARRRGMRCVCSGSRCARVLPLNKALWTGSFTLFTGGIAALALAACDSALNTDDVRWWAQPFVWLGVNALAIYFLAQLCGHLLDAPWGAAGAQAMTARSWIFWDVLQPVAPGMGEEALSLGFALLTVALWTGVAGLLYRSDIRIRV